MTSFLTLPLWTIAAPLVGGALLLTHAAGAVHLVFLVLGLVICVLAAVHHAEVVAHRTGEPFGTLLLACAVTAIELTLIVSLMAAGGPASSTLARDAVFAAVMIMLNGIVGLCLLTGGSRFGEQNFGLYGVSAALATIASIIVLTLVLPNFTTTTPGPYYSASQLGFIAIVSLVLYGTFVFIQAIRHRDYFLPRRAVARKAVHALPPTVSTALTSALLLLLCLAAVVFLAKLISPSVESAVARLGAPSSLVGIIIAAIVLTPEGLASLRAARANRLQTSLNLALGSALATIGLTIPAIAFLSLVKGWTLTLGIDVKSIVLLMLSLMVATLSLGTGRTTVLQGTVHLVIFAAYLFMTIIP